MAKEITSRFDTLRAVASLIEENITMRDFFNARIGELSDGEKKVLSIVSRHQPISAFDLRSHTRKITKTCREHCIISLATKKIITISNGKLTVHPAFMEVL